jgi:hypothetical protein
VHLAELVVLPGVEQDAFGDGGLAGVDVRTNADVADVGKVGRLGLGPSLVILCS